MGTVTNEQALTSDEERQLDGLLALVLLPSFTAREREIATRTARLAFRARSGDASLREEASRMERIAKACGEMADQRTAEVLALREAVQALKEYAQHKDGCAVHATRWTDAPMPYFSHQEPDPKPCDCGLSALLAAPLEKP